MSACPELCGCVESNQLLAQSAPQLCSPQPPPPSLFGGPLHGLCARILNTSPNLCTGTALIFCFMARKVSFLGKTNCQVIYKLLVILMSRGSPSTSRIMINICSPSLIFASFRGCTAMIRKRTQRCHGSRNVRQIQRYHRSRLDPGVGDAN